MLRYLLLFFSCIGFLNDCTTAAEREFGGHPSFGDKDLQTLRYWYGKGHPGTISEASHSALVDYRADYPALVVAATNKDQRALASLMSFSPMDGAAGGKKKPPFCISLSRIRGEFFFCLF